MELLIGCGSSRIKKLIPAGQSDEWNNLVTLDINNRHNPDVVWDLNDQPLPFDDNSSDSIHAYEVLEHLGHQGDYRSFFNLFSELWRILKPNGLLCGTSPSSRGKWAWGDPGHTRIISRETFIFLDQEEYAQVGKTAMTDYRWCYKADFDAAYLNDDGEGFAYALKAIKPSRIA